MRRQSGCRNTFSTHQIVHCLCSAFLRCPPTPSPCCTHLFWLLLLDQVKMQISVRRSSFIYVFMALSLTQSWPCHEASIARPVSNSWQPSHDDAHGPHLLDSNSGTAPHPGHQYLSKMIMVLSQCSYKGSQERDHCVPNKCLKTSPRLFKDHLCPAWHFPL